jgi:hypothetical protein
MKNLLLRYVNADRGKITPYSTRQPSTKTIGHEKAAHPTATAAPEPTKTATFPARRRRNQISEYLPQRRKGRRLQVRIIGKIFSSFRSKLGDFAPWRVRSVSRSFAQAMQILTFSNTKHPCA